MPESESAGNPTETQIGDNPKHKMFMAWKTTDDLGTHTIQYHHGAMGFGTSAHNFTMHDSEDNFVGTMGLDHEGTIQHIEVHPELRRQGLATKLYNFGHELNEDIDTIPAPKHSESRTAAGNAWATTVGGDVPKARGGLVDEQDYRHSRWGSLRETDIPKLKSHINEFHAKMMENGMDNKGVADSKFHVDSAHEYLTRAHELGKEHRSYSDTMSKAHEHIDELGDIHQEWYGDMDDHDKLQEHIGKLY
jgi:GNAT superfamily N-acetyltransferase